MAVFFFLIEIEIGGSNAEMQKLWKLCREWSLCPR